MTVPVFLEFVEIKTKLASLFPFVLGTLFTLYHFGSINALNTILFFDSGVKSGIFSRAGFIF